VHNTTDHDDVREVLSGHRPEPEEHVLRIPSRSHYGGLDAVWLADRARCESGREKKEEYSRRSNTIK